MTNFLGFVSSLEKTTHELHRIIEGMQENVSEHERLTSVQILTLMRIEEMGTVNTLGSVEFYGSNVVYNIKKLTGLGYIEKGLVKSDKRLRTLTVTEKGTELIKTIKHGLSVAVYETMNKHQAAFFSFELLYRDLVRARHIGEFQQRNLKDAEVGL